MQPSAIVEQSNGIRIDLAFSCEAPAFFTMSHKEKAFEAHGLVMMPILEICQRVLGRMMERALKTVVRLFQVF